MAVLSEKKLEKRYQDKSVSFSSYDMIIWAIAGICLWSLVSIFILRDIGWMLTFAGHAAFFPGFIGGIMFLWSHDKK